MSIVSNISISTAFFSDCNTFATPRRLYLRQSRVSEIENGLTTARVDYQVCFTELLAKDGACLLQDESVRKPLTAS